MFTLPRFLRYPAFPAVGFMLAGVGAMADGYSIIGALLALSGVGLLIAGYISGDRDRNPLGGPFQSDAEIAIAVSHRLEQLDIFADKPKRSDVPPPPPAEYPPARGGRK